MLSLEAMGIPVEYSHHEVAPSQHEIDLRYAEGLEASYLWKILQMTATVLINWLLFTILYKFLPRVPITWHDASRGGALVTFLWEVSRHVLAVVLLGRKYSAYGIVGSLLALILWLYVCNAMILFGAEYVRALRDEREETSDETTKLKTPVEHKT